jgi:hypothetical protein
VKGVKVLPASLDGADAKTLRETMDKLKDKLKSAAIVLGAVRRQGLAHRRRHGRPHRQGQGRRAGQLRRQQVGGKGGGRPDMAQAGGTEPAKLPPHGHVLLKTSDKTWHVVLAPPSRMERRGLPRTAIAPGAKVTVEGYAHRSKSDELRAERIHAVGRTIELR